MPRPPPPPRLTPDATQVLQGVSFTVPEGSVCALVGRSGGGKSTLVHLCLRFYDPTDGRVTLGGRDLRELAVASVHRRVGVVCPNGAARHRRSVHRYPPAHPSLTAPRMRLRC